MVGNPTIQTPNPILLQSSSTTTWTIPHIHTKSSKREDIIVNKTDSITYNWNKKGESNFSCSNKHKGTAKCYVFVLNLNHIWNNGFWSSAQAEVSCPNLRIDKF